MSNEKAAMSGPDHFREAERLLTEAEAAHRPEVERYYLDAAQVHATLAHVAVTADLASHTAPPAFRSAPNDRGWCELFHPEQLEAKGEPF